MIAAAPLLLVAFAAPAAAAPAAKAAPVAPAAARPTYPEGAAIPRGLTDEERAWLRSEPLRARRPTSPPPLGPLRCPAEYEPMQGILIAWEGQSSWLQILAQLGQLITTAGNADLYVAVDSASEEASARASLTAAGADMARVETIVTPTDTIWMRDYGPRYVYEGGVRVIVDHTYNRPRPNDDAFPIAFAALRNHARYDIPLVHGGGNYHLDAVRRSYATRLIANENPALTEADIRDLWQAYQGVDTTLFDPFPTNIDSTQHLDMWMEVIADDAVVVSDWPNDAGSVQDVICDGAAALMAARGYRVYRVPARAVGGTHYTYANVVMVNDIVIIPSYTDSQVSPLNAVALAAWQQALPGKTIVPLNAQSIVTASGVFHCIAMHVPAPTGGVNPTAYLESPRGCAELTPGAVADIRWISDDDRGTTAADLLLSTDSGQTYPTVIASGLADTGSYAWTVPALSTATARIKVVVHDGDGNSGADESDSDVAIGQPGGGFAPAVPQPLLAVKVATTEVMLVVPEPLPAAGYNVYEGPLGTWYTPDLVRCHRDASDPDFTRTGRGTVAYHVVPAAGDRWFLVSASSCGGESDLALPPAAWMCGPMP